MITDITEKELTALTIVRAIVHEIPKQLTGSGRTTKPDLSDEESPIDIKMRSLLQRRMTQTLGGKHAFDLTFLEKSESPVPGVVRGCTGSSKKRVDFIEESRRIANYLFELQDATNSGGLLCVLDCLVRDLRAFCILKVERESGARVNPTKKKGKHIIQMSVITDLILTTNARLFKSALFLRTGKENDDFLIRASDKQQPDIEIARFWRLFLGCEFKRSGRISTKRYLELNREYIDRFVSDPVEKAAWWQSILSELSSHKKAITPRLHIEQYVPEDHQQAFEEYLKENEFSLNKFPLDTSAIDKEIRRISFRGEKGSLVSVPTDQADLIKIESDRMVIADSVRSVG